MKHNLTNIIKLFLILCCVYCNTTIQAQVKGRVLNAANNEPLMGVSIHVKNAKKGTTTDTTGQFILNKSTPAKLVYTFTYSGFESKDTFINTDKNSTAEILTIYLTEKKEEMEEVILVSSSRTNSRIEDLPTKVEVLGAEEVHEENQIKPGNISSILGDIAGVQIQQTSSATANADMRIQGLSGKYTQLLRDGMPLYGGYGGSFSILQIPPLDLQQIELVKGSNSTLYGGGAIAGMVNLISKKPKLNQEDHSFTLNRSNLEETNFNTFHSGRNKKFGYTVFAGATNQNVIDVDKDGFSDVPKINNVFIHPRFFIYGKHKSEIAIGYTLTYEDRKGGDMQVMDNKADALHSFFISNKSIRHTADIIWDKKLNNNDGITAKASMSFFNRKVETNVNKLEGNQGLWYTEVAYNHNSKHHKWVAGINFNGDNFNKQLPDTTPLPNEQSNTLGAFVQDDWKINNKLFMQSGIRLDYHSIYGSYLLPRISLMYKPSKPFTFRLGAGLGYKNPELFTTELDERDYRFLKGYSTGISAERSYGLNCDINYKTKIGDWNLTFNQTFFHTKINKPILLDTSSRKYFYYNESNALKTTGSETYVQLKEDELEIYLGYVFTDAKRTYNSINPNVPLLAKNKFATIAQYEFSKHFRAGIEATYYGKQYLDNGTQTDSYLFGALMMNYKTGIFSFVLNCENLLDYRQNKNASVVIAPYTNPTFKELWAPTDGRIINLSMMVKW